MKTLENAIRQLREVKPIVLNLTNYVTMEFIANSLLALGASPMMSVCLEEIAELTNMAQSVLLNMGTLDQAWCDNAKKAMVFAKQYKRPVIFDPVGSGASMLRTSMLREILPYASIVRGNASEILSYGKNNLKTGIDSKHTSDEAKPMAIQLAQHYQCTVVISGAVDFITDGKKDICLSYGSPLMSFVTGMGCALTAIIAAFRAIIPDNFEASTLATTYFGLCGMLAAIKSPHPGSFQMHFVDTLYQADFQALRKFL